MVFAKLFEIENTQVLVLKGWNDEEDMPQVEFITEFEFGRIQINKGYDSEEKADKSFEIVNEEAAKEFLEQARQTNAHFLEN